MLFCVLLSAAALLLFTAFGRATDLPVNVGSGLELFVDEHLVESMDGGASLQLHQPVRREIVFKTDAPWEGNAVAYQSVFKDGDIYRLYYHGVHYRHSGEPAQARDDHPWNLCYAESTDGIHWTRPELGLFEFNGSRANNIIITKDSVAEIGGCPAHTAVFKDANPDCPEDARYKVIIVGSKPRGLYVLKSADGIHFSLMSPEPFVTEGAFDSQNLAFWDPVREQYREYHRGFKAGVRDIMTSTSDDFSHFGEPQWLAYTGVDPEHLYTNQIQPYYRAPHIFMGFPMRYVDKGWSDSVLDLPGVEERVIRAKSHPRYGTAVTDAVFMTSRDGSTFKRWPEAFIRPGPRTKHSWVYGDNFIFWGMFETPSAVEDAPNEISLLATECYWEDIYTAARRYTIRIDGFVSLSAPYPGGELLTKPLVFDGGNLALNLETSAAGGVRVELQDADGRPIEGYSLDECPEIRGDTLSHIVRWDGMGGDLRPITGKPVRLRFVLSDADIYSFQFVPYAPEPERPEGVDIGILPRKNPDRAPFAAAEFDFADMEAGTSPMALDLDPGAKGGGGKLHIISGAPDRVRVLNDDPVGSGKPGPSNYLRIERRDEPQTEGGMVWISLDPQDAADCAGGIIDLSARIYVPGTNKRRVQIDGYDNRAGDFLRRAFHLRVAPDGTATYYRDAEVPIEAIRLKPDTWQDVAIRADMAAGTFSVTVGGKSVEGLPFAHDGIRRIRTLAIGPNSGETALYLDAVKVEVTP